MSKNNPIQQRLNNLLSKWQEAVSKPNVKIVRILSTSDEEEMIQTFFEYLLAIDTDINDFTMIFYSSLNDSVTFSKTLLNEFEEEIEQWNTAKIPDSFDFKTINWKATYSADTSETKNVSELFVNNMNSFANYAFPEKDAKVCCVINMPTANKKMANKWLDDAVNCNWEAHLIITIADTEDFPVYDKIAQKHPDSIVTIKPDLNMDGAVEELAAQTDPSLPENAYRNALLKLMKAVKSRHSKKAENYAKECLKIAVKKIEKDPNWLAQIVTVYTVLYNSELGFKHYDKALYFADKAVEAALTALGNIDDALSYRLVGQTHMGRGGLQFLKKDYEAAVTNYLQAEKAYAHCQDHLMQCDALRLAGDAYIKFGDKKSALIEYEKAYSLVYKLMPELIANSTFPMVVKALLKYRDYQEPVKKQQLQKDLEPIFGANWEEIITNYGNYKKAS